MPKPWQKFGEFVLNLLYTIFLYAIFWDKGWWVLVGGIWLILTIQRFEDWMKEIDRSRNLKKILNG